MADWGETAACAKVGEKLGITCGQRCVKLVGRVDTGELSPRVSSFPQRNPQAMWTNKIWVTCEKSGYPQYPQPLLLLREQIDSAAELISCGPHLWKTRGPLFRCPTSRRSHLGLEKLSQSLPVPTDRTTGRHRLPRRLSAPPALLLPVPAPDQPRRGAHWCFRSPSTDMPTIHSLWARGGMMGRWYREQQAGGGFR
jgi:hypothetical protein